jgi:hypothetical protein
LFAEGASLICISHILLLKLLKRVYWDLQAMFPLNLKIKFQWYNVKGRPLD